MADDDAMKAIRVLVPLLLAAVLAGCDRQQAGPAAPGNSGDPPVVADNPEALPEAVPPVPPGADNVPAFTPADTLPPTRTLQVSVEGQTEGREATLFTSPQGYAIYVLPQLKMTPEEPCCDVAYARVDDGFFMRIERIDDAADLATLRENMALGLSAVGTPEEASPDVAAPGADMQVELAMRARGHDTSVEMLVARIDGGRYRITRHLPHREALEGIPASMRAMLGSLRTTGPRPGA